MTSEKSKLPFMFNPLSGMKKFKGKDFAIKELIVLLNDDYYYKVPVSTLSRWNIYLEELIKWIIDFGNREPSTKKDYVWKECEENDA